MLSQLYNAEKAYFCVDSLHFSEKSGMNYRQNSLRQNQIKSTSYSFFVLSIYSTAEYLVPNTGTAV